MADYPTQLSITMPDGSKLDLGGTLSDQAPIPPEPIPPEPDGLVEKIYKPEEFGGDFSAMRQKILTDQTAAGDDKMRAVVQFARAKTYEYTYNHFLDGVQNYRCEATGTGNRPILRNVNTTAAYDYDRGPLNIGKGACCFSDILDKNKNMALIATVKAGATTITLLTAGDASKLVPGRWHAVFSYCQQIGGYPPNVRWIDYIKVVSVSGTTVTLDRALKQDHYADNWEDPNNIESIGKARIGLWDGFRDGMRATLDGRWKGIEFNSPNPQGKDVTYIEAHISAIFEDCVLQDFSPSMCREVQCLGCSFTATEYQGAELDKLTETVILDGCTTAAGKYIMGASGMIDLVIRNSQLTCIYLVPRNLLVQDSTIDAMKDTYLNVPFTTAYNGPKLDYTFERVKFICSSPNSQGWSWESRPIDPLPLSAGSWSGNKLIIPRSFGAFESWLVWLYDGIMLFTGSRVSSPGNYGRVDKIYAPADGSALWCDVTWIKGTKPTSGNLNIPQKGHRLLTWKDVTIEGDWIDPDFISMSGTPADRPFPNGIT